MTERKIQDYLHFYLGCEVMTPDGIGWLASVSRDRRKMDGLLLDNMVKVDFKTIRATINSVDHPDRKRNSGVYLIYAENYVPLKSPQGSEPEFSLPGGIKPILRPLSDMTEDDVKKLDTSVFGIKNDTETAIAEYRAMLLKPWPIDSRPAFPIYVKTINELRRLGFDCDELIESGLAINKSTIQP